MKTVKFDIELDHHPTLIHQNMTNPALLDYIAEHHPAIEKIKILAVKQIDAVRTMIKLKLITVTPMPKAFKKLMKSRSDEMTSGMTMILEVNQESFTSRSEVIPEMMSDNVKSSSLSTFFQKGDKWLVHIEINVAIRALGLGGAIEKHFAENSKELTEKQYALINEFLSRNS